MVFRRAGCREICLSGSTRGEWDARCVALSPTLPRKTARLVEELRQAQWKPSPKTDADEECEFSYQPEGWSQPYRFVAVRKQKPREEVETEQPEQYQLFETSQYKYRVFVTDMSDPIHFVVWFYGQRGGAENLIKEANNDAGLAAHPSHRFDVNGNHFQLAMLAYNLNCWLMLFHRRTPGRRHRIETYDPGEFAAALPVRGG